MDITQLNNQINTPVKRYTKSELAGLYNRSVSTVMIWMNDHPELIQLLKETGYKKSQKVFKKAQVQLIFEHLGEP